MNGNRYITKTLTLSDLHLGKSLEMTPVIIKSIVDMMTDSVLEDLDIIWLAGDVLDKLIGLPENVVEPIQVWMCDLLRTCKARDIKLRILEGTPSHDRGQSIEFLRLNKLTGIGADVKYFRQLQIEYIEDLDIHVLYIPDEYHTSPEETYKECVELIKDYGLERVHYIVMHGMFDYQVPKGLPLKSHNSELYQRLVYRFIFIGHVHQSSEYGLIKAPGSPECFSFGDEGIKGCWLVTVDRRDRSKDKVTFVENKTPMVFKTFDLTNSDLTVITRKLDVIGDMQPGDRGRIKFDRDDVNLPFIKSRCISRPGIIWDFRPQSKIKDSSPNITTYVDKPLNNNTLESVVVNRLQAYGIDDDSLNMVKDILRKIMSN